MNNCVNRKTDHNVLFNMLGFCEGHNFHLFQYAIVINLGECDRVYVLDQYLVIHT